MTAPVPSPSPAQPEPGQQGAPSVAPSQPEASVSVTPSPGSDSLPVTGVDAWLLPAALILMTLGVLLVLVTGARARRG